MRGRWLGGWVWALLGACGGGDGGVELLGDGHAVGVDTAAADVAVYDTRLPALDVTALEDSGGPGDALVPADALDSLGADSEAADAGGVTDADDAIAAADSVAGVDSDAAGATDAMTLSDTAPPLDTLAPVALCGDGVRAGAEPCDGDDLGGASCESLGYLGGALACDGCAFDPRGCAVEVWSRKLGGVGEDRVTGLAVTPAGALALTGAVTAPVDFGGGSALAGAGNTDAFVLGLSGTGAYRFGRRFAGSDHDVPTAVAVWGEAATFVALSVSGTFDFGQGPVASPIASQAAFARLGESGQTVWTRFVAGNCCMEAVKGFGADASGGLYALAFTSSLSVDYGGGPLTAGHGQTLFVRLSPDGAHVASR